MRVIVSTTVGKRDMQKMYEHEKLEVDNARDVQDRKSKLPSAATVKKSE
jgi:hypothetical protein